MATPNDCAKGMSAALADDAHMARRQGWQLQHRRSGNGNPIHTVQKAYTVGPDGPCAGPLREGCHLILQATPLLRARFGKAGAQNQQQPRIPPGFHVAQRAFQMGSAKTVNHAVHEAWHRQQGCVADAPGDLRLLRVDRVDVPSITVLQ